MSATIGATLKKIAVSLRSDKKVLKTIGGIAIGIITIFNFNSQFTVLSWKY